MRWKLNNVAVKTAKLEDQQSYFKLKRKRVHLVLCFSQVDALSLTTINQSDYQNHFIHSCAVVKRTLLPLFKYHEAYIVNMV